MQAREAALGQSDPLGDLVQAQLLFGGLREHDQHAVAGKREVRIFERALQ